MYKNEIEWLAATVVPEGSTDEIVWSSSAPQIVEVSDQGKLVALGRGSATITATAGGVSEECQVNVYSPVTAISLNARELTVDKGSTFVMVATLEPEDATDKTVTWTSLDNDILSVNSNGVVSALKGGVTKIVAKAEDKVAECVVTVLAPVESVTINKPSLTLEKGRSEILYATVGPEDATDKTVFWSSSNPSVVSVNDYGKITAESVGTAIISAKAAGIAAECQVTVVLP